MRKGFLVLVLLVLAMSAYSQTLSIDLHAWGNNSQLRGVLSTSSFFPTIGIAYGTESMEFLSEIEFWSVIGNIESDMSASLTFFSIAAGISPKFEVTEKLFFAIPILAKYSRVGGKVDFDSEDMGIGINLLGIDLGLRAYYVLNSNWSLFSGAKTNAIVYGGNPTFKMGSTSEKIDFSLIQFFVSSSFSLGVRYSF